MSDENIILATINAAIDFIISGAEYIFTSGIIYLIIAAIILIAIWILFFL